MSSPLPKSPASTPELAYDDKDSSSDVLDKSHDPQQRQVVGAEAIDEAFTILSSGVKVDPPTPEQARRIRNKSIAVVLPFAGSIYGLMFLDKNSMANAAILGMQRDVNIDQDQFNSCVAAFYVGYLLLVLPQGAALQRFPIGRYLSCTLIVWSGLFFATLAAKNFATLYALRFLLGALEASAVPALMLTLAQFFTLSEQVVLHVCFWCVGNSSTIPAGLLAYASLFEKTPLAQWQVFVIILGSMTTAVSLLALCFYPDSPKNAWFLTPVERQQAVMRLQVNRSGIENKTYKREQLVEAIKDWKTWAFALHAFLQELGNGFSAQYSLIIKSYGFSQLATTLLGCIQGLVALVCLITAATVLHHRKDMRAYISMIMYIPVAISGLGSLVIPYTNKTGLLAVLYLRSSTGVPYAVVMSWAGSVTAGHTKKHTTICAYHVAYGLSNIASPYLFNSKYAPRFVAAWAVLLVLAAIAPAILVGVIRYLLVKENARREAAQAGQTDANIVFVETRGANGVVQRVPADVAHLDLTDRQNQYFRYVL